jgi:hypothetical protein
VEEVDGSPADSREVFNRLLQGPVEVLVVAWIDGRPDIGGGKTVEVSMAKEPVDLGAGIEEMGDQASEGRERWTMAVPQSRFVEAEDQVVDALGH